MKRFEDVLFAAGQCKRELDQFQELLARENEFLERKTLKPFFEAARQLSAFIGTYVSDIGWRYEFQIAGDFAADVVVGNRQSQTFCMIELEEATTQSIFAAGGRRSTSEWSRGFERGFSQLVDWFYALDDLKGTEKFTNTFGYGHAKFHGLLVIGRSAELSQADHNRLRWRGERVLVNSHPINCVTYDELHAHLSRRLLHYPAAIASGGGQTT